MNRPKPTTIEETIDRLWKEHRIFLASGNVKKAFSKAPLTRREEVAPLVFDTIIPYLKWLQGYLHRG